MENFQLELTRLIIFPYPIKLYTFSPINQDIVYINDNNLVETGIAI